MSDRDTIGVLGLGLIGGSIARDLSAQGKVVLGWDADADTLNAASATGAVVSLGESLSGLEAARLVILATPGRAARELIPAAAAKASRAVLSDVASTKRAILAAAGAAGVGDRFVGAHPFTGSERSGWSASRPGLFAGARVFLCPAAGSPPEALGSVRELWLALGARPETVDPTEHDRRMAWSSHSPQALSSALALALADAGVTHAALGPGGRDMTRLAAGSARLWSEILLDNGEAVVAALSAIAGRSQALAGAIEQGDEAALERLLMGARAWAEG